MKTIPIEIVPHIVDAETCVDEIDTYTPAYRNRVIEIISDSFVPAHKPNPEMSDAEIKEWFRSKLGWLRKCQDWSNQGDYDSMAYADANLDVLCALYTVLFDEPYTVLFHKSSEDAVETREGPKSGAQDLPESYEDAVEVREAPKIGPLDLLAKLREKRR